MGQFSLQVDAETREEAILKIEESAAALRRGIVPGNNAVFMQVDQQIEATEGVGQEEETEE